MSLQTITLKFFPKYQFLIGLNIQMHKTHSLEDEQVYDGIDIELGIGLLVFSLTILRKEKGAE